MTELELYHHGILGQKWGVRRYQNKDGSLTSSGKKRKENSNDIDNQKSKLTDKQKTYIKIGAAAVGTALATYGSYSAYKYFNNEYTKRLLAKGAYIANDHIGGSSAVFASGNATNYVSRKGISDNLINKIDLIEKVMASKIVSLNL